MYVDRYYFFLELQHLGTNLNYSVFICFVCIRGRGDVGRVNIFINSNTTHSFSFLFELIQQKNIGDG